MESIMYRLEKFDPNEFVIWEDSHYLGSLLRASNGMFEYTDKLGRTIRLDDPYGIVKILERKASERKE
jgi:hypothetical protein